MVGLYTWSRCGASLAYRGVSKDKGRINYALEEDAVYLKLEDQTMWDVDASGGMPLVHIRAWSLLMHPEIVEEVVILRAHFQADQDIERMVKVQTFMDAMEALKVDGPEEWDRGLQAMPRSHQNLVLDTMADMGWGRLLNSDPGYPKRWGLESLPLKFIFDRKILHGDAAEELEKNGISCSGSSQLGAASVRRVGRLKPGARERRSRR
jgi:hypothetical protein